MSLRSGQAVTCICNFATHDVSVTCVVKWDALFVMVENFFKGTRKNLKYFGHLNRLSEGEEQFGTMRSEVALL